MAPNPYAALQDFVNTGDAGYFYSADYFVKLGWLDENHKLTIPGQCILDSYNGPPSRVTGA